MQPRKIVWMALSSLLALAGLVSAFPVAEKPGWVVDGKNYDFVAHPEKVAVYFHAIPGDLPRYEVTSEAGTALLEPMTIYAEGRHGLVLYRLPKGVEAAGALAALENDRNIRYATEYLEPVLNTQPYIPTGTVLVRLHKDADVSRLREFCAANGLVELQEFGVSPRQYRAEATRATAKHVTDLCRELLAQADLVEWAHPNFVIERETRFTPTDPLYGDQWHLHNTGQGSGVVDTDIDAEEAWDLQTGNSSIKICVIDSGVQTDHPDLAANMLAGWDVVDEDNNPQDDDGHGTSCAGLVAAAQGNGIGGVGVAFSSGIIPIRFVVTGATLLDEAEAFDEAYTRDADVITNSWGPLPLPFFIPMAPSTKTAVDNCIDNGRGGLGIPIFFASGNSHQVGDNCDNDGYASYDRVIAVGAVANNGEIAPYSERCTALDITAPSNGGSIGITTTDRASAYTSAFGGTSAACPIAAGVAALVLADNPALTVWQLYAVMRSSTVKIDPANGNYNSGGFSTTYGYGLINAEMAVLNSNNAVPTTSAWGIVLLLLSLSTALLTWRRQEQE